MPFFTNISDTFRILPRAFGLDISDSGLKFVYLAERDGEYRVETFGERAFASGIVEKGRVLKPEKLAEVLQEALKREGGHGSLPPYAVVGFPEEDVFIRVVQVPKMGDRELAQAIRWEIEGNIPLSIESVYYAYQAINPPVAPLDHMDILVAAAPKEVVDGYVKTCALAAIVPLVVEPASVALARSLVPFSDSANLLAGSPSQAGAIVLLDLGAMHSRIAVYARGALRLTSSVPVRLEDAILNIMRTFSCDHAEAERMLFTHGLSKGAHKGELFGAIIPTFTDLKEQIGKYMDFQKTHREHEHTKSGPLLGDDRPPGGGADFVSIVVAGGGALIPGIDEYFSEVLNTPVQLADPWVNIPLRRKEEIPQIPYRDALRFASSIGLALRGVLPPASLDETNFFAGG